MSDKDPLEQAEEVLHEVEMNLAAEITRSHAEMVLLCAVMQKPAIQGVLLLKASAQGIDYMTGMLVAVGLTARNWGRLLADDATLDFTQYIDSEAEADCSQSDLFAHRLVRDILTIEDIPATDHVRQEMKGYYLDHDAHQWARIVIHTIGLYAELLTSVLDIRNGDYSLKADSICDHCHQQGHSFEDCPEADDDR